MSLHGPILLLAALLALPAPSAIAQSSDADGPAPAPRVPGLDVVPESVYGTPPLRTPGAGFNDGAVHFGFDIRYATDYVFRGIEPVEPATSEDAVNVGVDAELRFDLGRLPDPFVRIITNTAEGDDISNFQVIRPLVGLRWNFEPFELAVGHQSFTYPDRDALDTSEVYLDFQLNDATFGGDEGAFLGPYVFAAYDYDAFEGLYVEGGLRRDFRVGDSSLHVGYNAHVAYVDGLGDLFSAALADAEDAAGFQHYQVGATLRYDLNELLNLSRRYGQWSVEGYLNYTDGIDDDLRAETQLWGGGGFVFRY